MKMILVVDDSATDRAFLEAILKKGGYGVITASSGEAGLRRAAVDQPDLIVMDVVMPGLNGFQATRTLGQEERTRHIPVVICSSKSLDSDRIWALRQGAKEYVTKPLDKMRLLETIGALTA